MRVNRDLVCRAVREMQRVRFTCEDIVDELLKEEAALRDCLDPVQLQLAVIFHEHRVAGRLQKEDRRVRDRKSTRLNSSHANISYAVFCLKKKKNEKADLYPPLQKIRRMP